MHTPQATKFVSAQNKQPSFELLMGALQVCMLVLPFVSLCREKEKQMKKLLKPLHRRENRLTTH